MVSIRGVETGLCQLLHLPVFRTIRLGYVIEPGLADHVETIEPRLDALGAHRRQRRSRAGDAAQVLDKTRSVVNEEQRAVVHFLVIRAPEEGLDPVGSQMPGEIVRAVDARRTRTVVELDGAAHGRRESGVGQALGDVIVAEGEGPLAWGQASALPLPIVDEKSDPVFSRPFEFPVVYLGRLLSVETEGGRPLWVFQHRLPEIGDPPAPVGPIQRADQRDRCHRLRIGNLGGGSHRHFRKNPEGQSPGGCAAGCCRHRQGNVIISRGGELHHPLHRLLDLVGQMERCPVGRLPHEHARRRRQMRCGHQPVGMPVEKPSSEDNRATRANQRLVRLEFTDGHEGRGKIEGRIIFDRFQFGNTNQSGLLLRTTGCGQTDGIGLHRVGGKKLNPGL